MELKFANALVGRLFGRRLPYNFLSSELHKRWGHLDGFRLLDVGQDCFVCQFAHQSDCDAILCSGPWIVAGQVLGLDVWTPNFAASSTVGSTTPLWIRLPGLPLYAWDIANLALIASALGTPLWVDPCTAAVDRAAYARVCVRIDLSQPLKSGVWIDGLYGRFYQPVEYENISVICFQCGIVGHKESTCPSKAPQPVAVQVSPSQHPAAVPSAPPNLPSSQQPNAAPSTQPNPPIAQASVTQQVPSVPSAPCGPSTSAAPSSGLGPWMLVTNRRHRPQQSRNLNSSQHPVGITSSRQLKGKSPVSSQPHTTAYVPGAKNPFAGSHHPEVNASMCLPFSTGKKAAAKPTNRARPQRPQTSTHDQVDPSRPKRLRSTSPLNPSHLTPHG
ncbi:hypothetical protein AXF42_Ash020306 [Apostasia shenzhenica]|uniref:CCHC-type domain-containing protein n=1 Tax=Apostasia shenzhenica TaxID=1088818 RepID=A0A2H9ZSZ9_9ASPA|nr:hypothetical protein AXF42_Ash020306 [Apostasia shenzhenica]